MKRWLILLIQTAVTIGLLLWLFRDGLLRENLIYAASHCDFRWVLASVAICGILNFLGICRWRIFLRALNIHVSFLRSTQLYFIGAFFNLVMVGAVGGDAVKAGYLMGEGQPKTASFLSVILDRISGFGALIVASAVLIGLRYEWLMRSPVVAGLMYFVFTFLIGTSFILAFSLIVAVKGWQQRLPANLPFRKLLVEFADAYAVFLREWRGTLLASFLSLIMLCCYFLSFYFGSRAISANIPMVDFFAIMPAVDIISALPISLSGMGVREQLFTTLLGQLAGVAATSALLISIMGFLSNALWGLLGACFFPFYSGLTDRTETNQHTMNDRGVCWKIAQQFRERTALKYYAFCKLTLDPAYRAISRILKNSDLPLMDVGCGVCLLMSYLREYGHDFQMYGIDIDERKINCARKVFDSPDVVLEIGSATDLPDFSGNIAVLDVIHYFDDETQQDILNSIADRVSPGGHALIRIAIKDISWRYGITLAEDIFTRAIRWIRGGKINFPTIDEVRAPFLERGFVVHVEPLWGCTPFNSYLFDCHRIPAVAETGEETAMR
ncbi:MAG: flippase-like domain-containing protein [Chthoniobacterales bacterium]